MTPRRQVADGEGREVTSERRSGSTWDTSRFGNGDTIPVRRTEAGHVPRIGHVPRFCIHSIPLSLYTYSARA